jgi:hypothetical protein
MIKVTSFHQPDIRLFSVSGIRPDIRQVQSGTVSGRLPDTKTGRIIQPDIQFTVSLIVSVPVPVLVTIANF